MNSFNAIIEYGKAWISLVKDHYHLFMLEAKLTKLSILPFITSCLLGLMFLTTLWMIFLITIAYFAFFFTHNVWLALLLTFLMNGLALIITVRYLRNFYNNLGFKKTKAHLASYRQLQLEFPYEYNGHKRDSLQN